MNASLRRLVIRRAGNRCEYCHIHQDHAEYYTFHVEHPIARQHVIETPFLGEAQEAVRAEIANAGKPPVFVI